MTEIRQPFGPGVEQQPGLGISDPVQQPPAAPEQIPTTPVPTSPKPSAGVEGIGSLEWWAKQRVAPSVLDATLAADGVGTLGKANSLQWSVIKSDPRNMTVHDNRWPTMLQNPMTMDLPSGGGEGPRLGQFELDMLDFRVNLNQLENYGLPSGVGDSVFNILNARDIDFFSWDIPSRMADYAIAAPIGWVGRLMGGEVENITNSILDFMASGEESDNWYSWQHKPEYWQWIESSPDERAMRQQAYQMARQSYGGGQDPLVISSLMKQFQMDHDKYVTGATSGDKRIDYIAKWETMNGWQGADEYLPDATPEQREAWADDMVERIWKRDPGLTEDKASVREWLLKGMKAGSGGSPLEIAEAMEGHEEDLQRLRDGDISWEEFKNISGTDLKPYGFFDGLAHDLASNIARNVPAIGHDAATLIAPTSRFEEAFWMELEAEDRMKALGSESINTMVGDMALVFGGMFVLAPYLSVGAMANAPRAIQLGAQGASAALKWGKVAMAVSLAEMGAHLAIAANDPQYAATTGARIDAARPISNSYAAGLYNFVGLFSTGTWGAYTAVQMGGVPVRGAARFAGRWVERASGLKVPKGGLRGEWEPTIVQQAFGGAASKARNFIVDIGISPVTHENSLKSVITSYLVHSDMDKMIKSSTDAVTDLKPGTAPVESGTPLDLWKVSAQLRYIEESGRYFDPQASAVTQWTTLNMHMREPSTWSKIMDDAHNQAWKWGQKAQKSLDSEIAHNFLRDYSGSHGLTAPAIRDSIKARVQRIRKNYPDAIENVDALDEALRKVGDDVEELERVGHTMRAIEFYLENGEFTAAVKGSTERLHLMTQRTLAQDDVTETVLNTLRANDGDAQRLKAELRDSKETVARLLAHEDLSPKDLADVLTEIYEGLPRRRQLPMGPDAVGDTLNAYHRRLVADGEWDLGFIPYMDEAVAPGRGDFIIPVGPDGKINLRMKPAPRAELEAAFIADAKATPRNLEPLPGDMLHRSSNGAVYRNHAVATNHSLRPSSTLGWSDEAYEAVLRVIDADEAFAFKLAGKTQAEQVSIVEKEIVRRLTKEIGPPDEALLVTRRLEGEERILAEIQDALAKDPGDTTGHGWTLKGLDAQQAKVDASKARLDELSKVEEEIPVGKGYYERKAKTGADLGPGYRKLLPGEEVAADRELHPTLTDGVWTNEIPGETPVIRTNGSTGGPSVTVPGHRMNVQSVDPIAENSLHNGSPYIATGEPYPSLYDGVLRPADPSNPKLNGAPTKVSGFNAGAEWPILQDPDGNLWLFKSGKHGADLDEAFIETEFRIGQIYNLIGLEGATTIPYRHGGVAGHVQPYYSGLQDINMGQLWMNWDGFSQEAREQIMGHWMMDWLFSQHDTNTLSLFFKTDGNIVGVDKGQAFRYFTNGDWPPRLEFNPNFDGSGIAEMPGPGVPQSHFRGYNQPTINNALAEARANGIVFNRGDLEPALQRLESMSDEVFDQQMLRIGMARENGGYLPDGMTATDFAAEMASRRRSMRGMMNRVYADELGSGRIPSPNAELKYFTTGKPIEYSPDFNDIVPIRMKNLDPDIVAMEADNARFYEPDEVPNTTKAAVIITEPDGSIWMVEPTNHFDDVISTFPKGGRNAGESLRRAAVREAREETGFDVALDKYLTDWTDPATGEVTRYYVGYRMGGGPGQVEIDPRIINQTTWEASGEAENLILGKPDHHKGLIIQGSKEARDMRILDEYIHLKTTGTLKHQIDNAPAGGIAAAGDEAASIPGQTPETARRYVSYKRLRGGQYVRMPWVDQIMDAPAGVSIGNRTFIGGKADAAFRGFRTWRIAQTQRANFARRMANEYAGINNEQITVFQRELEKIAEAHHVPVQYIGNAQSHALTTASGVGRVYRDELWAAAEKVFGKTLVNKQTGAVISIRDVPWRDIITKSYRQAFKHNLTAGFTSWVYSLPGGWAPALVGQNLWPTLKFTISPIFKVSEYAESFGFNAMRGIGMSDDMLELYAPHMGFSHEMIAGEYGLTARINGMGFYRAHGPGSAASSGASFSMLGQKSNVRKLRVWEDVGEIAPLPADVSPEAVRTFVTSDAGPLYPRTLPDYTPDGLIPRRETIDGDIIVDPEVAAWDAARREYNSTFRQNSWDKPLTTREEVAQAMYGLAVVRALGFDRIDRLVKSMPLIHNPGPGWLTSIDLHKSSGRHAGRNGPIGGRLDAGLVHAKTNREGKALDWSSGPSARGNYSDSGAMGSQEMYALTGGQAKYAILGDRSTLSSSYGSVQIVYKHDVFPRALITSGDRIGLSYRFPSSGMSAQGLIEQKRLAFIKALSDMSPNQTLDEVLNPTLLDNEVAIYHAPSWDEVDALLFQSVKDKRAFLRKVAKAPDEVKEKLRTIELKVVDYADPHGSIGWQEFAENWMWEKSGLEDLRSINPVFPRDDSLIGLLDPALLPPTSGTVLFNSVKNRAAAAGYDIDIPGGYGSPESRASVMDDLAYHINTLDAEVIDAFNTAARESLEQGRQATGHGTYIGVARRRDEAIALWRQMDELRQSGSLQYTSLPAARNAETEILRNLPGATKDTVVRRMGELRKDVTDGTKTYDDIMYALQDPDEIAFKVLTNAERNDLTQIYSDMAQISEMTERWASIKFSGMTGGSTGMDVWELFGVRGRVRKSTGERVETLSDPVPLSTGSSGTGTAAARRDYVDAQAVIRALGDDLPPTVSQSEQVFPSSMRAELVPPEFVDQLHALSKARNGYDAGRPNVSVYVRGRETGMRSAGPMADDEVQLVIVAHSADKQSLGLTLQEIENLWLEYGFPTKGVIPHYPTARQVGWDGLRNRIVIGDLDNVPRLQGADGAAAGIDGTGIPGMEVVFEEVFTPNGQAYYSIGSMSDPHIVVPNDIAVETIDSAVGSLLRHSYRSDSGTWKWEASFDDATIDASDPIHGWHQGHMADMKYRDLFEFVRDPDRGGGQSWKVMVDFSRDTFQQRSLKRLWYLDEIPDNVVFYDMAQGKVIDNADFQIMYGAPQELKAATPKNGLENIAGTEENVIEVMMRHWQDELGISDADLLSGDINRIMQATSPDLQKTGLWEAFRNFMDPIPYKERAMTRQAMQELNRIFVGALKVTDHPALRLFKQLGIPEHEISNWLLKDRKLLNQWLLTGRQMDLDRLIAHADMWTSGRPGYQQMVESRLISAADDVGVAEAIAVAERNPPSDEAKALMDALTTSETLVRINQAFRDGDWLALRANGIPDELLNPTTMQSALNEIAGSHAMSGPKVIYRGAHNGPFVGKKVGDSVDLDGALFAADDLERAAGYMRDGSPGSGTIIRFNMPKGSKFGVDELGDYVLQGGEYHVLKRETIDGVEYIDVAPGPPPHYESPALGSLDQMDALYSSTDYQTLTTLWRQSLKAAQDEAFGTHFFNPYRSWFERSLNHPMFGIYPLSWSLKAAREWARFLFDNRILGNGTIRLGMTPAIAMTEWIRTLNTLAAQHGLDLGEGLDIFGPMGNSLMIASLLMPGDWSSVSFPWSRTIRDVARGERDPYTLWDRAMGGGIQRDIRLGYESGEEWFKTMMNYAPDGAQDFFGYTDERQPSIGKGIRPTAPKGMLQPLVDSTAP